VPLAPVAGELRRPQVGGETLEQFPGLDGRQLLGVADEYQLGFGAGAGVDQVGELAGAHHRGFIHQHDRASVQRLVPGVEVEEEVVDGAAGDARSRLQAAGGSGREGTSQYPGAARLPCGPGGVEANVLPEPGVPTTTSI
jgi:hypothetical protein